MIYHHFRVASWLLEVEIVSWPMRDTSHSQQKVRRNRKKVYFRHQSPYPPDLLPRFTICRLQKISVLWKIRSLDVRRCRRFGHIIKRHFFYDHFQWWWLFFLPLRLVCKVCFHHEFGCERTLTQQFCEIEKWHRISFGLWKINTIFSVARHTLNGSKALALESFESLPKKFNLKYKKPDNKNEF